MIFDPDKNPHIWSKADVDKCVDMLITIFLT